MTVVRDAAYYGTARGVERFGQTTVFRLVSDEYEKLHELDFNYFNHTRTGDIMSRRTSDTDASRHLLRWVTSQALMSDEYEKLHELDFNYFNHTRTGDIMSRRTSDTDASRHLLRWVTSQALNCVVRFVGALAMMSSIDWRLALALACVTPPLFLLTRALSQRDKPLFIGIRKSLAARSCSSARLR